MNEMSLEKNGDSSEERLCDMRFSTENMNTQRFSMPRSTMLYIIKAHKSLAFHQKFMRLCKFTYDKNRVVPVFGLEQRKCLQGFKGTTNGELDEIVLDIDLEKGNFKLWIIRDKLFHLSNEPLPPDTASKLLAKTYRWDDISSFVSQVLTLNEFKFICNGISEKINLAYGTVIDEHASPIPIKNVLEHIPPVLIFKYHFLDAKLPGKKAVMEEVASIIDFSLKSNVRNLEIYGLTDEFDVNAINSFLMNTQRMIVHLSFDGVLRPEYVEELKILRNRLLKRYLGLGSNVRGHVSIWFPN